MSDEKPQGYIDKLLVLMKANSEQADERWKRWVPDKRYRYQKRQLEEMYRSLTQEERTHVIDVLKRTQRTKGKAGKGEKRSKLGPNYLKAAAELRMPYDLVREVARRWIEEGRSLVNDDIPEGDLKAQFELVLRRVVLELDRRTKTDTQLSHLSLEELASTARICRENIATLSSMQVNPDTQPMEIVTKMPFEEKA